MRTKIITMLCLAALLTGCEQAASKIDVFESRRELTGVIERGTEELSAQHLKMMQDDIEGLKAEVARSQANAAEAINKANDASRKAIDEQQARLRELQDVRDFVKAFAPEQARVIVDIATRGLDNRINTLDTMARDIGGKIDVAATRINTTESTLAKVGDTITEVSRELRTVGASAETAAVIASRSEKDAGELEDDLDNRTRDGIIGLLAAATGGGALAKTGKSRAHKEILDIETKVAALGAIRGGLSEATILKQGTGGQSGKGNP